MDPEGDNSCITVNVSTSMCIDFSSMGSQCRQSGDTVVPFACWAEEAARMADEGKLDMIFHECTRSHPSEHTFQHYFGTQASGKFLQFTYVLSPDNFGWPCTRLRRITLLISKRLAATMVLAPSSLDAEGLKPFSSCDGPVATFGTTVKSTAKILYNASPADVKEHLARAAKAALTLGTKLLSLGTRCVGDASRMQKPLDPLSLEAALANIESRGCSVAARKRCRPAEIRGVLSKPTSCCECDVAVCMLFLSLCDMRLGGPRPGCRSRRPRSSRMSSTRASSSACGATSTSALRPQQGRSSQLARSTT